MDLMTGFLAIPFPDIDPIALSLGPIKIRWYGLAYMAGLLIGWYYVRQLLSNGALWPNNKAPFSVAKVDDLLIFVAIGVILGGRLGYVLFYKPATYLQNPIEIFHIWKGGMAFHGALVGSGLAIWLFAKRNALNPLSVMDLAAAAVPIGLIFGRVANFINGELFGRPTGVSWGMVFPSARFQYPQIEPTPRHPSQLYEAALEGLLLFIVLRVLTHQRLSLKRPGVVIGSFLIGYALARSFCELFRQYDVQHALSTYGVTPGIVYSIPMLLLGVWFVVKAKSNSGGVNAHE
ncbi:MAG: prolipoprotein diacylglyceryl transferase [Hyphomicrobiaceae bacterium]